MLAMSCCSSPIPDSDSDFATLSKPMSKPCSRQEFAGQAPCQIVPMLADPGEYIASESSFYRVLNSRGLLHHRGRDKAKGSIKKPTSHRAHGANQVWSWDISYLPTRVVGQYYYLYLMEDIFSRKIVGAEVQLRESGEFGAELLERAFRFLDDGRLGSTTTLFPP